MLPPLVFGAGVFWHLLRNGRRYDAVHVCSFPYSSLLAASLLHRRSKYRLVVDWFEVWGRAYWRDYLGGPAGLLGSTLQRACVLFPSPDQVFCFSHLHARRLQEEGFRGPFTILSGLYAGPTVAAEPGAAEPLALFAGRMIPEKRVTVGVAAVALAARRIPGLKAIFYGEGPEHKLLLRTIEQEGVGDIVSAPGWAKERVLDADQRRALCMLSPSRREGFGLVVVEAAARATPSVIVAGEDNAATELVSEGINGAIAPSEEPEAIADAIVRVYEGGLPLRESTARWFSENAQRLSLKGSLRTVLASYASDTGGTDAYVGSDEADDPDGACAGATR